MTDAAWAAVTYVGLPVSSGGAHSLGRMSRRLAHQRTMDFLETCTRPVTPIEYSFTLHEVPDLEPQPDLEAEVARRFGEGGQVAVPSERIHDALDLLDDVDPQPAKWGMAPLWLQATARFQIVDPDTGHVLPGQDPARFAAKEYEWGVALGTSGLRLSLENHARLAIELCIPNADPELIQRIAPWLQEHLPCKLSSKHWRTWVPTKAGSFRAGRLVMPHGWPRTRI